MPLHRLARPRPGVPGEGLRGSVVVRPHRRAVCMQDPALHDLESNFLIQQKLVEAARKLASEPDLCKTVRRKRKQDYTDAVRRLQEIEKAVNEYRIRCGKKPSQQGAALPPGEPPRARGPRGPGAAGERKEARDSPQLSLQVVWRLGLRVRPWSSGPVSRCRTSASLSSSGRQPHRRVGPSLDRCTFTWPRGIARHALDHTQHAGSGPCALDPAGVSRSPPCRFARACSAGVGIRAGAMTVVSGGYLKMWAQCS